MRPFQDFAVWRAAHQLTLRTYAVTADFPRRELFGITSQMRRSVASIPTNIAEGSGRDGDGEFLQFLRIALGSATEFEYQLLLARDLEYINNQTYVSVLADLESIKKMLVGFMKAVQERKSAAQRPSRQSLVASRPGPQGPSR